MPNIGVKLSMTVDDAEFKRYMRDAQKRAKNLGPFFRQASMTMFRSFGENFKQQGRPKRWKTLAPGTIAGRRKRSSRILQDTRRLELSVMAKARPGNIYHQTKDSLKMGTNLSVAAYHQYGTRPYDIVPRNAKVLRFIGASGNVIFAKRVRHPGLVARPFILIQDEDAEEITELAGRHVVGE